VLRRRIGIDCHTVGLNKIDDLSIAAEVESCAVDKIRSVERE